MPLTPDELEELADQASVALQAIQNDQGRTNTPRARIRFPRGWIGRAVSFRNRYWYAEGATVFNVSYAHITLDVFSWIVERTDLTGVARDMIFKESICLLGSIVEALCSHTTKGRIGKSHKFKERTKRMVAAGMIAQATKDEVDWLWDLRGSVHIDELPNSELAAYRAADVDRAIQALTSLHNDLDAHFTAEWS